MNNYLKTSWSGQLDVNLDDLDEEFKVVTMEDEDSADDRNDAEPGKHLSLSVHSKQDGVQHGGGSRDVYIYAEERSSNSQGSKLTYVVVWEFDIQAIAPYSHFHPQIPKKALQCSRNPKKFNYKTI